MILDLQLKLSSFGSYFELMAALNLGYAGLTKFRDGVDNIVLGVDKTMTLEKMAHKKEQLLGEINDLKAIISTELADLNDINTDVKEFTILLDEDTTIFNEYIDKIHKKEQKGREFINGLQSSFLLTGLYCLFVLIIQGYSDFYDQNSHEISICLLLFSTIGVFNIIFFFRSFFDKWFDKSIKPTYLVTILFGVLFMSIFSCKLFPEIWTQTYLGMDDRDIITVAVVVALSPYFLHFLRIWIRKFNYRKVKFKLWEMRLYALTELIEIKSAKLVITSVNINWWRDSVLKKRFKKSDRKEYWHNLKYLFFRKLSTIFCTVVD